MRVPRTVELRRRIVGRADVVVLQQRRTKLLNSLGIGAIGLEKQHVSLIGAQFSSAIHRQVEPLQGCVSRMLHELDDLLHVLRILSQKQQGEMRNLLRGDLPDMVVLIRNGHNDKIAHIDLLSNSTESGSDISGCLKGSGSVQSVASRLVLSRHSDSRSCSLIASSRYDDVGGSNSRRVRRCTQVLTLVNRTRSSGRYESHSADSSSMTKPASGPTPRSVRVENSVLIWVMMSRSNDVSSGPMPKIFFVLFRMLCSILHLLLSR